MTVKGGKKMKGECFKTIREIIPEEEAWDRVFKSEEFECEVETIRDSWRRNGISYFYGFHLRNDGNVELEA